MKKFLKATGLVLVGVVAGIAGCVVAEKNGINVSEVLTDIISSKAE